MSVANLRTALYYCDQTAQTLPEYVRINNCTLLGCNAGRPIAVIGNSALSERNGYNTGPWCSFALHMSKVTLTK